MEHRIKNRPAHQLAGVLNLDASFIVSCPTREAHGKGLVLAQGAGR